VQTTNHLFSVNWFILIVIGHSEVFTSNGIRRADNRSFITILDHFNRGSC
jgi:hypothetical protein